MLCQPPIGSSHLPPFNTVGLLSITPLAIRRGVDHRGFSESGLSVMIAHTPPRPSHAATACAQKSHSLPLGSSQMHSSKARTYQGGSIANFGLDHVRPLSPLVTSTT